MDKSRVDHHAILDQAAVDTTLLRIYRHEREDAAEIRQALGDR